MSTLTVDLKAALLSDTRITAIVEQRVHAEVSPVELTTPYLTVVSNVEERLTDLSVIDVGVTARSRVMVTCWNGLGGNLSDLSQAVVDVLDGIFTEPRGGTFIQTLTYRGRREVQGPIPHVGPVPVEGIELTFDCWHQE